MNRFPFNKKLLLVFIVFFVLAFGNYFLLQQLEEERRTDGAVIDIAGRNRMLSQQLGFYAEQVVRGNEEARDMLKNIIALHQTSLEVLKNGGVPPTSLLESQLLGCQPGIPCPIAPKLIERALPKSGEDILPVIQDVEVLWRVYKENAEIIAREPLRIDGDIHPNVLTAVQYIEANAEEMLKKNNALVKVYVAMSDSKQAQMNGVLLVLFFINIIAIALGTWLITLINKSSEELRMESESLLKKIEIEKDKVIALAGDLSKFKMVVENASDHIIITDTEGIVLYGNKAMEKTTGYSVQEALGRKAGVLWSFPMPKEYYMNMWHVIKEEKKTFRGEIQNKRKNGEAYTAQIAISPVLNDNGDVLYFVGIERDISKEKEIDKAKTEFVALASHQLRTPLSAISWYTEMLLTGDVGSLTEKQKKYLEEVYTGNRRMVALVNALLNVSRLDLGTLSIETEPVDVIGITKSIIGELQPTILKKNITIQEKYGENIPKFLADANLLRSVVQNLVSNAVKYSLPQGLITIDWSVVQKNELFGDKKMLEDTLAFSVTDLGIGIPKKQQHKVFAKLFRADNASELESEGTGLGLYIVKSIVDQSGGNVWLTSAEKKGSTFYMTFPLSGMNKKNGSKKLD